MSDSKPEQSKSSGVPYHGTRQQEEIDENTKKVSSQILDLLTLKGKVSRPGPGSLPCENKARDKYFQMLHSWNVIPPKGQSAGIEEAVEDLKKSLPKQGWEIKSFGRDSSPNRNLSLTADHDKKKFSVNVVGQVKDKQPKLVVRVISACYKVPAGETVEHY